MGVGQRPLGAVGHHVRAQIGGPGRDRGAAVRQRDGRGGSLGQGEPPGGLGRPPCQRPEPGADDSQGRELHQVLVAEPAKPFSANGITLSTASPSLAHITFNADGTATVTITGLSGHISVPGQGTVALSAGRFVLLLTDDQPPQILAENGIFSFGHGDLPPIEEQLCSVLS